MKRFWAMTIPHITLTQGIQLISAATALISVFTLYWGSLGVPWGIQSYSGKSDAELHWKRRIVVMKWIGIPCAIVSFVCQVYAILIGA
jgi:hypothetical protein